MFVCSTLGCDEKGKIVLESLNNISQKIHLEKVVIQQMQKYALQSSQQVGKQAIITAIN